MESIRARCSQCLMKSVFVFRQQYILLGPLSQGTPSDTYGGNLFKFLSRERNKKGVDLGISGLEISLRGRDWVGVYMTLGVTGNWGFWEKWLLKGFK